ncbi:MAG TPA: F0F1 ATP synthase subunit delta [Candidatus Limnocylindrales bacterium]|nr:F0F1 ATP synthase subunit delta [Candidatus Limnocylindrales bacterium]
MEGASKASLAGVKKRLDEVAGQDADRREIGEQLFSFADLLDRELRLRRALADPGSDEDARRGLARRLLEGQLSEATLDLVSDLVGSRWSSPVDLLVATDELAAQAFFSAEESGSGGTGTGSGSLDQIEDELFRFGRLVGRESRLALALSDPALPADRKSGLVERLLGDRATETTQRLVARLVTHPRGQSIPRALERLAELASERRSRYIAVVTSARPLEGDQAERLRSALSSSFGRDMDLQVDVDPALLGGLVVRVGDELVDGTVSRRLSDLRRRLLR